MPTLPALLTTTYELDDLKPVSFGERGFYPAITWDDIAVQLNRDAVVLHPQLVYKLGKVCRREFPLFSIDGEGHTW
jgi:hypothetical protein